jgi:hypothetical protein
MESDISEFRTSYLMLALSGICREKLASAVNATRVTTERKVMKSYMFFLEQRAAKRAQ